MVRRLLIALALLALAGPAGAQETDGGIELPAAVAEERITVSSDYRGSYITVFGVNPDRRARGEIVVVVRGPNESVTVMRKQRVFGLLMNGDPVRFSETPSFFAVLSNAELSTITTPQLIHRYQLDPAASAQLETAVPDADPSAYRAALVRLRRAQGLYQSYTAPPTLEDRSGLTIYPGGLFRAVVRLPANAPITEYIADAYVFRDGRLISSQRIPIGFARVGIEGFIHTMATSASFFYGVFVVLFALGAGWLAAFLFRRA
ncbi:MAG TPA: TIGR02186 family protein [Terricaulis sp.]|nr:TIGR02186 family protein [Terricaulis sp.]